MQTWSDINEELDDDPYYENEIDKKLYEATRVKLNTIK